MKKNVFFIFVALLSFQFFLQTSVSEAQTAPDADKIRIFEEFVQRQMKADQVPGLTIGFIKDGNIWVKGYGFSDLENRVPARPESAYRLASVTKPMTAIAILQLVEQGKIDLDAEVQKYVPYFPKKKYPVTVRYLLGHLGGISHYKNYDLEGHFKDHKNTREAIKVFEDFELVAEPGTRFNYTSYGYNLLGAVIEGASGKRYGEYMRENIWKPLEMNDTRMDDPNQIIPNRVRGYRLINGKVTNSEFVDISSRFSAGGTRSTVVDLLKFADGLSQGKLLSAENRGQMWTAMKTRGGVFTDYGMGWVIFPGNGHFAVSHSGAQAETRTYLYVMPNHNFAIAAAVNFEDASAGTYVERLFELILDEPWQGINIYAKDKNDLTELRAMDEAFKYGVRHFDQYRKPLTMETSELNRSFAFFNDSLKLTKPEAEKKLQTGRHPAANEAFVKMASFMASKLKEESGEKDFDKYFQNGAITFFDDYIKLYKKTPDHPSELKFSPAFEKKVEKWNSDWKKSWNADTRNLRITEANDLESVGKQLQTSFSNASVYPNYIGEIDNLVRNFVTAGNFEKAKQTGELGVALYPESDRTNGLLGLLYFLAGDKDNAMNFINKSYKIDPKGFAGAGNLNAIAYDLSSINQAEAGLNLLKLAVGLHPKEANLYDSIGEFYKNMKQKEKAIEFYSKALEIDPNYPNAANAKKILEELKNESIGKK